MVCNGFRHGEELPIEILEGNKRVELQEEKNYQVKEKLFELHKILEDIFRL